jgi:hypothetical protein
MNLEQILQRMSEYGKPSVSHTGKGWHGSIEMHVASQGATFNIRSEFCLPTPLSAAQQCLERMDQALADFQKDAGKNILERKS